MDGAWLASYVALWIFVILEALLILALLRQTAILLIRVSSQSVPPLAEEGLAVGSFAPPFTAESLAGETYTFPQDGGLPSLLAFISPTCKPCQELLPALNEMALERSGSIRILLLSTPGREVNLEFASRHRVEVPLLVPLAGDVVSRYQVTGTPFVYVVAPDGRILSKGFASSKQPLEGLIRQGLELQREGVASG